MSWFELISQWPLSQVRVNSLCPVQAKGGVLAMCTRQICAPPLIHICCWDTPSSHSAHTCLNKFTIGTPIPQKCKSGNTKEQWKLVSHVFKALKTPKLLGFEAVTLLFNLSWLLSMGCPHNCLQLVWWLTIAIMGCLMGRCDWRLPQDTFWICRFHMCLCLFGIISCGLLGNASAPLGQPRRPAVASVALGPLPLSQSFEEVHNWDTCSLKSAYVVTQKNSKSMSCMFAMPWKLWILSLGSEATQ